MTKTLLFGAALLTALAAPTAARAATYKVGPSHAQKAPTTSFLSTLKPGDVVEIDGDATYGKFDITASGTQAQPIVIRGVRKNGKRPVISSSGGWTVHVDRTQWVVIEGLEITGGDYCLRHHAANTVVRDVEIHHCTNGVLGTDGDSGSLTLEYSEIHHNGSGTQHHQIYMATDENAHPGAVFRLRHSYIHDATGGNNVKSRAERNEIRYNWIEGATYHELELIGPDQSPWDPNGDLPPREDSDVVGNVIRTTTNAWCTVRVGGDGTGGTSGRFRFVNNTFLVPSSMTGAVFRLFQKLETIEMHNNVFYAGGGAVKIALQQGFDSQGDERPEDIYTWSTGKKLISGANNWISSKMTAVPSPWTNTITGSDPGFTNLAALDLRPQASSPLVDAGTATTQSPAGYAFPNPLALPLAMPPARALQAVGSALARTVQGVGVDIGAFERSSGVIPSPDAGTPAVPDAGTPAVPDAGTPAVPDAGTPAVPDAGTPAVPDAGTPAVPDAGTPAVPDAGTPAVPDAGTPAVPDAGTPAVPDAGTPPTSDAGTPPTSDAGAPTAPDSGTPPGADLGEGAGLGSIGAAPDDVLLEGGCAISGGSSAAGSLAPLVLLLGLALLRRRRASRAKA